jgi:Uma2 family endonuclease
MIAKPVRRRLTADDFDQMCSAGILTADDRVELIDGELIEMPPMGPPHTGIVNRLAEILFSRLSDAAKLRVQSSVRLSNHTQPEPDLAIVKPDPNHYLLRHPRPADILLAIEVADSSLDYDREQKVPRYAAAGVAEVWLVDVGQKQVTIYSAPSSGGYGHSRKVAWEKEIVATRVEGLRLTFEEFLPRALFE